MYLDIPVLPGAEQSENHLKSTTGEAENQVCCAGGHCGLLHTFGERSGTLKFCSEMNNAQFVLAIHAEFD